MTSILVCRKCNQKVRVPTDKGELAIRCPKCKHCWDWSPNEANSSGAGEASDENKAPAQTGLLHHTLNTGHSITIARTHVPDYAIEQAKSMLNTGRHPIKFVPGGYECDVTIVKHALLATVYKGERALVTFGVAPNFEAAIELWTVMIGNYALFRDGIMKVDDRVKTVEQVVGTFPVSVPWCTVICLLIQDGEFWLANLEQMVAWAWIETVEALDKK